MWRDYEAAVVGEELRAMRDHGMTVTRSFFYWPDFMPTPWALDRQMVARFRDFLDQHSTLGNHDPHVHRGSHVGSELGPAVA